MSSVWNGRVWRLSLAVSRWNPGRRGPIPAAHAGSPTILAVTILAVDVGTSSVRVAAVDGDGHVVLEHARQLLPATPSPGLVELDGQAVAAAVLEMALEVIRCVGSVEAVGIANQRGSRPRRAIRPKSPAPSSPDAREPRLPPPYTGQSFPDCPVR